MSTRSATNIRCRFRYHVYVEDGDHVIPGQQFTDGAKDPQQVLLTRGREDVQRYIIDEVQKVYRSQGVNTNDKHIEVICRQMLRKVSIVYPGDTDFLQDERIDRFEFNQINEEILAQGGEPATAMPVLLGITKASLETDSFLSAASFQETTRVLTEAAINGKVDQLRGLKENVIIGKLIPAGSGFYGPGIRSVTSDLDEASPHRRCWKTAVVSRSSKRGGQKRISSDLDGRADSFPTVAAIVPSARVSSKASESWTAGRGFERIAVRDFAIQNGRRVAAPAFAFPVFFERRAPDVSETEPISLVRTAKDARAIRISKYRVNSALTGRVPTR